MAYVLALIAPLPVHTSKNVESLCVVKLADLPSIATVFLESNSKV
jgi:hypothetical protein